MPPPSPCHSAPLLRHSPLQQHTTLPCDALPLGSGPQGIRPSPLGIKVYAEVGERAKLLSV
uniref:Uncharacterized protein n=1 Tax=Oryza meridionalis TaxID=40149 RepID=A0A0E0C1Q1_9ORYZ